MFGWLGRKAGGRPPAGLHLPTLLAAYPPDPPPHPGPGRDLTEAQARENLRHKLAGREARLAALTGLLAEFDIDLPAGLDAPSADPLLNSLHHWAAQHWASIYDPRLADLDVWLRSTRTGDELVFSMLADVGLALGELVVRRRPEYAWNLDRDLQNLAGELVSYNRPVVMRPRDQVIPVDIVYDFEDAARTHYAYADRPEFFMANPLGYSVRHALTGAHERHWREQP